VGLANEMSSIARKKTIVTIINRQWNVAAKVLVSYDFILERGYETVAWDSLAPECELHGAIPLKILHARDEAAIHPPAPPFFSARQIH